MRKKRSAGSLLDVFKGQHFDAAISLTRRVAIKLARYKQTGATNYDPQIVDGSIGNLVGAFLMQLVGSPATRPAFGHLWGLGGVPAIYNGGGKATPIFDSWANQDTDIAQLTVDIGIQTLTGGEYGEIYRGTKDDDQSLVFLAGGGTGGGGGASPYGFAAVDGSVHFDGVTNPTIYMEGSGSSAVLQGYYNAGIGGGGGPSYKYYLNRDIIADTLTLDAGVLLFPNGHRIFAKTLVGTGKISGSPHDFFDVPYTTTAAINGGSSPGTSAANFSVPVGITAPLLDGSGKSYGRGGAGGASASGGAGGTAGSGPGGAAYEFASISRLVSAPIGGITGLGGGCAGACGRNNGAGGFGKGGAGGDVLYLIIMDVSGFGGVIESKGSPGVPATALSGAGGGGGGGGGAALLATLNGGGSVATDFSGGAGSAGGGGGAAAGTAGSAGAAFVQSN